MKYIKDTCLVYLCLLSFLNAFHNHNKGYKYIISNKVSFTRFNTFISSNRPSPSLDESLLIEKKLVESLNSLDARGAKANTTTISLIDGYVSSLENFKGIKSPVKSKEIDGCWKLLYTSSPGTNSPIQRTVTATSSVSVYQVINLIDTSNSFLDDKSPDVSNTVCIGDKCRLRVTALASTVYRPLVEPRKGDGKIFGLNIFGVSSSQPPRDLDERIDFSFQEAQFEFSNKFPFPSIPYPVPFKLLGDEAKGWIDNTYLSKTLRIARGNKGTLFILKKVDDPKAETSAELAIRSKSEMKKKDFKFGNFNMNFLNAKDKNTNKKNKKIKRSVTLIFPAQLSSGKDYDQLIEDLRDQYNIESYSVPLSFIDWPTGLLPSFFSRDYLLGTLKPMYIFIIYIYIYIYIYTLLA